MKIIRKQSSIKNRFKTDQILSFSMEEKSKIVGIHYDYVYGDETWRVNEFDDVFNSINDFIIKNPKAKITSITPITKRKQADFIYDDDAVTDGSAKGIDNRVIIAYKE